MAGAVGERELVVDEPRRHPALTGEQVDHLGHATRVEQALGRHGGVLGPSRMLVGGQLGGEHLEPRPVAQVAALEHGVLGRAAERRVDGRRHTARVDAVEHLVQALDSGAGIDLGADLGALRTDGARLVAQVVAGIDHVVMAAPGAGDDGRVAGPGDRREVDDRATVELRGPLAQAAQVGQRVGVAVEPVEQLGLVQAVEQEHVQPGGRRGVVVDDLVEHPAVLAVEVDVGPDATLARGAPCGVGTVDEREVERRQACGRDVDGAGCQRVLAGSHPPTAEPQRRAGLADVQRAVGAGLAARAPVAGRHGDVRRVRRVEQLGDALVGEGVGLLLGGDEPPCRIVGVEAAGGRSGALGAHRGQGERVLLGHWVGADRLEHLEVQRAVVVDESPEAHHAARRPHLVRSVVGCRAAPGEQQIDLRPRDGVGEQGVDGPVARLLLVGVEALAAESFGPVDAHGATVARPGVRRGCVPPSGRTSGAAMLWPAPSARRRRPPRFRLPPSRR